MKVREQVRRLWQEVFDDDDSFIDLYFSRIYTDSINYSIEYDGKTVSALQAIPFDFKLGKKILKTAYLSGIATDLCYRCKGFMRQLLDKTHQSLKVQGFDAAWLIPANNYLFDIYATFGYKTAFYKDYKKIDVSQTSTLSNGIIVDKLNGNDKEIAYQYFLNQQIKQYSGVIFSREFFDIVVDAFAIEQSHIMVAKDRQNIIGIAFVQPQGTVLKLFANSKEAEQAILAHIAKTLSTKEIILKNNDKVSPYGMMLIFDKNIELSPTLLPQVSLMLDE